MNKSFFIGFINSLFNKDVYKRQERQYLAEGNIQRKGEGYAREMGAVGDNADHSRQSYKPTLTRPYG